MQVTKSKQGIKITLPRYKINIRKLTGTKTSYQYTCILPPVLCSFFNIGTDTPEAEDEDNYNNLLMFYELDDYNLILSGNDFYKALLNQHEHNTLSMISSYGQEAKPELIKYCQDNPINYKLFDTIHYTEQYNTSVYKLSNSNSYRVTLPNQLFKPHINHTKDNYILFTIDTTKEDLQSNKGIITYEIINI